MTDLTTPPSHTAILCRDERLTRLLSIELERLGVAAAPLSEPPTEAYRLIVWDADEYPLHAGMPPAVAASLLLFGREEVTPPHDGRTLFLRRPFRLTDLEGALRALLGDIPVPPSLMPPARPASAAPSPLQAKDGVVTLGEHSVTLTPAEWEIFSALYSRAGEVVPREALDALLEGGGNSVDVYVCRLRTKIEKPLGRRLIHTVRGQGYRFSE